MVERLLRIDSHKLQKHRILSEAMEFVEHSRKEIPHLEILDTRKEEIKKYYTKIDKNEADLRLAIDEFVIRLLASHDFGLLDIGDSIDNCTPGLEIENDWIVQDEISKMMDSGILVWRPGRNFGLTPKAQELFK
jgi:hypothetical protein